MLKRALKKEFNSWDYLNLVFSAFCSLTRPSDRIFIKNLVIPYFNFCQCFVLTFSNISSHLSVNYSFINRSIVRSSFCLLSLQGKWSTKFKSNPLMPPLNSQRVLLNQPIHSKNQIPKKLYPKSTSIPYFTLIARTNYSISS